MMKKISVDDVERLRRIFRRLREFRDVWTTRDDDPEDMWAEAHEMAVTLVSEMEPVMRRLDDEETTS